MSVSGGSAASAPERRGGRRDAVPDRPSLTNRLAHLLVGLTFKPFWGPAYEGLERLPKTGRLIVACNHRHWADTLIVPLVVQRVRYPRFLGKEELFRNPLAGWLMRELGIIRLDRRRGDVSALKQAMEVLGQEGCLVLFPEGTRSRTDKPLRAKPGLGFLAARSGAPVVPGRLRHTERFPQRVTMTLTLGEPLRYSGDGSRESCQAFADRVMDEIFKL